MSENLCGRELCAVPGEFVNSASPGICEPICSAVGIIIPPQRQCGLTVDSFTGGVISGARTVTRGHAVGRGPDICIGGDSVNVDRQCRIGYMHGVINDGDMLPLAQRER